jgi:amino-acid N-acetyltransferase
VDDLVEDIGYSAASPGDLAAVKALLDRCDLPSEDLRPGHLEHFVLCWLGERVVGTIGLEPLGHVALLRSFAVEPDLRRRRLGHELWARVREHALACGIGRLYLLTTTAEALFRRWNFRRIAREQAPEIVRSTIEFSSMCPSTATVMEMELAGT